MGERNITEILDELARKLKPQMRTDGYLSADEAAQFLGGIPVATLAEKTRHLEIPSYKLGRYVVYDPKDLHAYVKKNKR